MWLPEVAQFTGDFVLSQNEPLSWARGEMRKVRLFVLSCSSQCISRAWEEAHGVYDSFLSYLQAKTFSQTVQTWFQEKKKASLRAKGRWMLNWSDWVREVGGGTGKANQRRSIRLRLKAGGSCVMGRPRMKTHVRFAAGKQDELLSGEITLEDTELVRKTVEKAKPLCIASIRQTKKKKRRLSGKGGLSQSPRELHLQ